MMKSFSSFNFQTVSFEVRFKIAFCSASFTGFLIMAALMQGGSEVEVDCFANMIKID